MKNNALFGCLFSMLPAKFSERLVDKGVWVGNDTIQIDMQLIFIQNSLFKTRKQQLIVKLLS